ncbi:MAG: PQQ-binding-like beta-propeller repeat protein [Candidatus Riflebacteria bacterium]|nr:PQQ-binding-like beta-propeller repeat protein [Candidatus Riflebacteria bacterium]
MKKYLPVILILTGFLLYYLVASQAETTPVWRKSLPYKVLYDPVKLPSGETLVLAGEKGRHEYIVYKIASDGSLAAQSQIIKSSPYDPLVIGDSLVLTLYNRMIEIYNLSDLKLRWQVVAEGNFQTSPVKMTDTAFLQAVDNIIYCIDTENNTQKWDKVFPNAILQVGADRAVVCITSGSESVPGDFRAYALNPENGSLLWECPEAVRNDPPLFYGNDVILTTAAGVLTSINQKTGESKKLIELKGVRAIKILDDAVLYLVTGGSGIGCVILDSEKPKVWTASLQRGFVEAVRIDDSLFLVDKHSLRCINIRTGYPIWIKDLKDIYMAYSVPGGIFVNHKTSFTSPIIFGKFFDAETGNVECLAKGRSQFKQPIYQDNGIMLFSFDGSYRLMPKK